MPEIAHLNYGNKKFDIWREIADLKAKAAEAKEREEQLIKLAKKGRYADCPK